LAYVHAQRDRGRIDAMIRVAVEDYGFVGIKVHRNDARISREVCEAARAYALPILYDAETELDVLDWLARGFPDVPIIVPHLSSFAEKWRSQAAFVERLADYDNLYTDSSGVRFFDLLQRAVERCGPNKLLFGSDGPWLHPGLELAKIRALRLSPEAERMVLGGNFLRLIAAEVSPTEAAGTRRRPPADALPAAAAGFGR
jgi:predicted TIM-barrel fold metal-dependent hydrolase